MVNWFDSVEVMDATMDAKNILYTPLVSLRSGGDPGLTPRNSANPTVVRSQLFSGHLRRRCSDSGANG